MNMAWPTLDEMIPTRPEHTNPYDDEALEEEPLGWYKRSRSVVVDDEMSGLGQVSSHRALKFGTFMALAAAGLYWLLSD